MFLSLAAAMAYPHHIPTSRMSPPRFATNSDVIEVRPQFPMINNRSEQHSGFEQHSLKRARMTGNNHSNALPCPPPRMMHSPPQSNKGTGHIFYKTRTCTRFMFGNCRNGDNCNFAHGEEELRQLPPNWQDYVGPRNEEQVQVGNWDDDKKIIHKMKLCKKFYNGEQCPYGEKCSFLHEDPANWPENIAPLPNFPSAIENWPENTVHWIYTFPNKRIIMRENP
ncbi:hypothetical protein TSUD_194340 [Trifolium subterraneum]|uniref:C3H1-type domain-containing protein n=1 Tax=Trifolium subterraneum TaxID=3900 RepID=A0A2Z6P1N9_TRISU|nr:hypothetical protein TSUD_194340 [Trifolium subterraneum]